MAGQNSNTQQDGQTFITANHKRENLKVSQMTPQERLHYLRVKQKFSHLTNDEENQLNDLMKNQGSEVEFNNNRDLKKTEPKEKEEIKDIFKEEDILSYMYQHWLLDGANWLFKKTYSAVETGTDWLAAKTWQGGKKFCKGFKEGWGDNPNGRDDAMSRFTNDVDKNYVTASGNQITGIDAYAQDRMAQIDRYIHGNPKDEEKNSLLYQMVSRMNDQEKAAFAQNMQESTKNFANHMKVIQYMAATLTRAQLIQNEMAKEDVDRAPDKEVFEKRMKINAILIAQKLKREPNSLEDLFKKIEKASQTVNESMDAGKYKSNKHKWRNSPKKNKALISVNATLGLNEKGNLRNTNTEDRSQYNLLEWAIRNNIIDEQHSQRNNNTQGNETNNPNRHDNLLRRICQMPPNVHVPPHLVEQADKMRPQQQANDNRQQRPNTQNGNGGR